MEFTSIKVMEELLDSVKKQGGGKKKSTLKRDTEKDIDQMQAKLGRLMRAEAKRSADPSADLLADQYFESRRVEGEMKVNRIDETSYGKIWSRLPLDKKEELLMEFFDQYEDTMFDDKESIIAEGMNRLHNKQLNTAKQVKYDRVNQRVIKLLDLKFNVETEQFYWSNKVEKKTRPKWMKNMLKKK